MNISWSREILQYLHRQGVREIVFCPGARNSPLVSVLSRTRGFDLHSFFEERAGAFYALGIARRTGRPVAVITTSGTAAAELLPAVIEAYHTGVPLILLTADRPRRLRGTGAPQAIDQTGLFAKFVDLEFDLEQGQVADLGAWNRRSPVHLNICFDEPLIDEPIEDLELEVGEIIAPFPGTSAFSTSAGTDWAALRLTKFLRAEGPLVVVVGTLETAEERDAVLRFLLALGAPVYLESTSGLREREELRQVALRAGDKVLAWGLKLNMFTRVLRIGGIPTVRIWRDLDEGASPVQVLSLTALPFAGLSRGETVCAELAPVLSAVLTSVNANPQTIPAELLVKDREAARELQALLREEPLAEPSLVWALSLQAPGLVYVGNSLPIREWDLAAGFARPIAVEANRGVNGIDGQIATFFGLARDSSESWCLLGDLTALYDLAAPWALALRPGLRARVLIINNGGGQIFNRIFKNDLFINRHGVGFEHWARMWGLGYQRWSEIPALIEPATGVEVIELVPDEAATRRFWDRYDALWS